MQSSSSSASNANTMVARSHGSNGERCLLEWPYVNADSLQLLVGEFANACPDSLNVLRLENSGAHTAQRIRWPAHVWCVWLPPYGPELNPLERVWRDLQDDLAWQQFLDLDSQQVYVADVLQAYSPLMLQALTGYAYLVGAINARCA
jgi:hypothetical protein